MEDTVLGSEVQVTQVVDHIDEEHTIKVPNGDLLPDEDDKKEEEENALDAEFIKVEKESIYVKERSGEDVRPIVLLRSTSSERELLEAKEKVRELEIEIETLVSSLKHSESENKRLNESRKKCEELELNLSSLKEELVGQELKHKELTEVNESFEALVGELTRELELRKASDSQIKEDMSAIESLFASSKEDLKSKISELEDAKAKMETQEVQITVMKAELGVTIKEKEEFQINVENLTKTVDQLKELNGDLEDKLKVSDKKFCESDAKLELDQTIGDSEMAVEETKLKENMTHQRSLELKDLIQKSQTKVGEMELVLEAKNNKIQELEEQNSSLEKKCKDAEADSKKYYDKMSETLFELEAFQARASSLEVALAAANEKERESTESLNIVSEEKKHLESAIDTPRKKLVESENLLQMLRSELNLAQGKITSMENDLEASRIRESELIEKFKSTDVQLEQSTARNLELQEEVTKFTCKDFDAQVLSGKLIDLEEKVKIYEEQVSEFGAKSADLKDELDQTSTKSASLESANEVLKRQISEVEIKASQYTSENELLVDTNIQLKSKVDELEKLLNSEKEVASKPIVSHKSSSEELMENHSRSIEADNQRDEEVNDLKEKLKSLECQLTIFEEHAQEASSNAEFHRAQMEETLVKFKHLESVVMELENKGSQLESENVGLAEANMRLAQEMAVHESKSIDDQEFSPAQDSRSDYAVDRSERLIKNLTQELTSDKQSFQFQISSVVEENNLLKLTNQNTKRELQSTIEQLEEQLKQQKENENSLFSEIRTLRAEIEEKTGLETLIKELEEKLKTFEAQLKAEVKGVEVNSRENGIGSIGTSPTKKAGTTSLQLEAVTHTAEVFSIGTLKVILAVAMVSVIIGIILGKRY